MASVLPVEPKAPGLTDRDRQFNRIISCLEYANSYSMSASQSAFRGDEEGLKKELGALRVCVIEALKVSKELGS